MPTTDRQATELLLPVVLLQHVVQCAPELRDDRFRDINPLLLAEAVAIVVDRSASDREKLFRRVGRAVAAVAGPYMRRSDCKLALMIFHMLNELATAGYLVIGEGAAIRRALDLMAPALEIEAGEPAADSSARKHAGKLLRAFQAHGYFSGC